MLLQAISLGEVAADSLTEDCLIGYEYGDYFLGLLVAAIVKFQYLHGSGFEGANRLSTKVVTDLLDLTGLGSGDSSAIIDGAPFLYIPIFTK